jgi:plastocyanin
MAIVAAGSALVLAACGSSSADNGGGTSCTAKGGSTSGTGTQVVKINPDPNTVGTYVPPTVTITKGQMVEWDWIDTSAQHSVTSDDTTTFDSCLQGAGSKFVVTFSQSGDFAYHCQIHAQMIGHVKVT